MRYVTWTIAALAALIVGVFLHYTLPRQDVVRIVGVEVQRITTGGSLFYASSESSSPDGTRDVKIINAIRESGRPSVYRNEDTGWGWPPYFKFNSSDVQARAADLTSTAAAPTWILLKRYGWRNQFFSIYPNAVSVREVAGPNDKPLPWMNILILAGLAAGLFGIYRMASRFYQRRIDPVIDNITDVFDGDDETAEPTPAPQPAKKSLLARLTGR